MKKLWKSSWLVVLLCCFLFCHKAVAAEDVDAVEQVSGNEVVVVAEPVAEDESVAASEYVPVVRQEVGIVLLGNSRYLQPVYQDMLDRYFVRCYSRYRFPTEFGEEMQQKFAYAYASLGENGKNGKKDDKKKYAKHIEDNLPLLVERMGKDQVLFLQISDRVMRKWRRFGPMFGSETVWEAYMEMTATLVDRHGVVRKEKIFRWIDDQYTPTRALTEVYTYCLRKLQQKKLFEAATKEEKTEGEVKTDEI